VAKFTRKQLARANEVALADERGETTWVQLDKQVNQLIHALRDVGLQPGDTMAVFAGNCREYFTIMTAAAHSGIVFVPVNWHFTAEELQYVVDDAQCKLLFVEGQFEDLAESVVTAAGVSLTRIGIRSKAEGLADFEAFCATGSDAEPEHQVMGGPMFYTSGTTGRPKGVRSSNFGDAVPVDVLEMMSAGMSGMLSIPLDGRTFICGPVYHSAQWAFSFLPLMAGSQVVMRHRFDAA